MNDTIAAISTTLGVGAISIIRVSGPTAINIVSQMFQGAELTNVDSHTIHYGKIITANEVIDEVLVTVMRGPKTFTTEDTVEINCHGGIATTNRVLELTLSLGARLAEPGEFTKRAFLNGRIDLVEADSVMDLISAKTELSRKIAINQLSGTSSKVITTLRDKLIQVISNIEVNIDYPEYEDIKVVNNHEVLPLLNEVRKEIKQVLAQSDTANIINKGINFGIVGRPNVGKSSLLNALLDEEKAIVTDVAGTTRDIVEGQIIIDGIIFNLIDTAGIRATNDIVEKIGVQKSREIIEKSDLVLFVINGSEALKAEDKEILKSLQNKNYLVIVNKIDLGINPQNDLATKSEIKISLKEQVGTDKLIAKIKDIYKLGQINITDFTYLSNARSVNLLKNALTNINQAIDNINNGIPIDIVEIDIKEAWQKLGEIIGQTYTDELLDQLFSRFCLGK